MPYAAIVTKYLPATNHRQGRIKATCQAGSVVIAYPHELSINAAHAKAARALASKWGWGGVYVQGALPQGTGTGFCFVSIPISRDGSSPVIPGDETAFVVDREEADAAQQKWLAKMRPAAG